MKNTMAIRAIGHAMNSGKALRTAFPTPNLAHHVPPFAQGEVFFPFSPSRNDNICHNGHGVKGKSGDIRHHGAKMVGGRGWSWWLVVVMYGGGWSCLVVFGRVCQCMMVGYHVWWLVVTFGGAWSWLVMYGHGWSCMVVVGGHGGWSWS
jgi:hypothetical protein